MKWSVGLYCFLHLLHAGLLSVSTPNMNAPLTGESSHAVLFTVFIQEHKQELMLVRYNLTQDFWYCLTVSNFYLSLMQMKPCCNHLARLADGIKMERWKKRKKKVSNRQTRTMKTKHGLCQLVFNSSTIRGSAINWDKQWKGQTPPHTSKLRQKYRSWQGDKRERGRLHVDLCIFGARVRRRAALWFLWPEKRLGGESIVI